MNYGEYMALISFIATTSPPHPLQGQKVSLLAAFDSVLKGAKQSYKDDALINQIEINFPYI
jgi:hypothetical protein